MSERVLIYVFFILFGVSGLCYSQGGWPAGGYLYGDVTGAVGSNTVQRVNGGSVPLYGNLLGSNGKGQLTVARGLS